MQLRLGRPRRSAEEAERGRRRASPATVVSIALHVVFAVAFWWAIQVPMTLERWLRPSREEITQERLFYVPVAPSAPAPASRSPSEERSTPSPAGAPTAPVAPPLIAPREVPTGLPTAPATPPVTAPSTPPGPLAGGTGPTRGIQPALVDPRIWVEDPKLIYAPKTAEERLDSALIATIKRKADSIAANTYTPNKFERGDWTVEKNGGKYGIDPDYIRLGKFSIPTALLALLPFNRGGSPVDPQRDRNVAAMRADIAYHADVALKEQEFRAAVRAIRDRKERERKSQGQQLSSGRSRRSEPGVTVSPGERPPQ
jgi:hypothetical protein